MTNSVYEEPNYGLKSGVNAVRDALDNYEIRKEIIYLEMAKVMMDGLTNRKVKNHPSVVQQRERLNKLEAEKVK